MIIITNYYIKDNNMKEILLCKQGELVLKGLNRKWFEDLLAKRLKECIKPYGNFKVYASQSTTYVEPLDDFADIEGAFEAALKVFGFVSVSRAVVCEKNIEDIKKKAAEYLPKYLEGKKSFKAEARRSDKRFPLTSPQISAEVGGAILEVRPDLKVKMDDPEITVRIELRETNAYVHAGAFKGAGGMPVGSNGKAMLLLSGGIDSPVAGYMMAKRGLNLDAVHFESFPYTSERAKEKVLKLAELVSVYSGGIYVHVISLTHIQEELRKTCEEEYFTLLLRRFMMRLAEKTARRNRCKALITGESLGQVASQTLDALNVTDSVVNMPVFRPCIGMDKEEIITISRKINTFETSILPYEDCCTVFTPKHPKTRPEMERVLEQEAKLDIEALENEAMASLQTIKVLFEG